MCLYLLEEFKDESSVAFAHLCFFFFFCFTSLFLSDDLFLLTTFSHSEKLLFFSVAPKCYSAALVKSGFKVNMSNKDCKQQVWVHLSAFRDELISVADSVFPVTTCTASSGLHVHG